MRSNTVRPHRSTPPSQPIEHTKVKDKDDIDRDNLKDQLLQWHCLFGHIGLQRIQKLLGKSAPDCLRLTRHEIHDCVHCLLAKSLQQSPLSPTNRSVEPLELVIADLMGPFNIATIKGGHYALNIRDASSTYSECHILANKSDAAV
ncbi:hypothetical protein O181_028516 [Austropuccinia psidii MF-1]|uniref:GAG-pre-integrase domain-containing protein n=1 Tax=Austropuccinia psidii MF-1 TaxID=1389203 RepID=A0A9Q3H2G2_9BASI|nr:hypothetical protein [Austropuccinia psidii MF-1]